MSNWVERKAKRASLLDEKATHIWDEVRSALIDACNSHREYYQGNAEAVPQNGHRVRITRTHPADPMTAAPPVQLDVLVVFDEQKRLITATSAAQKACKFSIDVDDDGAFLAAGESRVTPDEVSERILQNVLFYRKPTASQLSVL